MIQRIVVLLVLSCWILSCQAQNKKAGVTATAFNAQPLDSLTTNFLVHAHDSVDKWSATLVSQLSKALQRQGIDTILYYSSGCSGCEILVEPGKPNCDCNSTELLSYLYWQRHGQTFVKRLDCCQNNPISSTLADAFDFYYQNKSVLEEGRQFYLDFARYNKEHPNKPRFLPTGPIHDEIRHIRLQTGTHQIEINVWMGEYDTKGNPLFLDYRWRRKQWEWANRLEKLPVVFRK